MRVDFFFGGGRVVGRSILWGGINILGGFGIGRVRGINFILQEQYFFLGGGLFFIILAFLGGGKLIFAFDLVLVLISGFGYEGLGFW